MRRDVSRARARSRARFVLRRAWRAAAARRSAPSGMLIDGRRRRPPPVALDGIDGPTIATTVRVVVRPVALARRRRASCLGVDRGATPAGAVDRARRRQRRERHVPRPRRARLVACDDSRGRREERDLWCGRAFGRLEDGRLRIRGSISPCRAQRRAGGVRLGRAVADARVRRRVDSRASPRSTRSRPAFRCASRRRPVSIIGDVSAHRSTITEHDGDGALLRALHAGGAVAG